MHSYLQKLLNHSPDLFTDTENLSLGTGIEMIVILIDKELANVRSNLMAVYISYTMSNLLSYWLEMIVEF